MSNVLKPEAQRTVLNLLVEGNSLRSTSRLTGIHLTTIMNLMVRFGDSCRDFMDAEMRDLTILIVELPPKVLACEVSYHNERKADKGGQE